MLLRILSNKEKISERKKVYTSQNKDKIRERRRLYDETHKEQIKQSRTILNQCACGGRYQAMNKIQQNNTKDDTVLIRFALLKIIQSSSVALTVADKKKHVSEPRGQSYRFFSTEVTCVGHVCGSNVRGILNFLGIPNPYFIYFFFSPTCI